MVFLIENMPTTDLQTLSSQFLLTNVELAYAALEQAPWRTNISAELFLNEILPYACLNEARDPWRAEFQRRFTPLVAECSTPGEAALLLNRRIFPVLKVRYDTDRRRPDQSPRESIETGTASCTGLSILLVDACRAVGIPARIAGTAMWANMRGNHTWVEVWDEGWHFVGAAEPDDAGLDHAWFVHDAAEAKRDVPQNAIFATSFRRTGEHFPLGWLPGDTSIAAVNVTDRYIVKTTNAAKGEVRLSVKVLGPDGKRIAADVVVTEEGNTEMRWIDKSRPESADLNDLATFDLATGHRYHLVARQGGREIESLVTATEEPWQMVTLKLPVSATPVGAATPVKPLTTREAADLQIELSKYFSATLTRQTQWRFSKRFDRILANNESVVREAAWEAYRSVPIHSGLKSDFDAQVVTFEEHVSPYTVREVGKRPERGWPLFIAMHGGGGAPKELNDSQWKQMQIHYKEHPEQGGYLYLALRAPNDTWNGFYDDYVYPLVDRLILQFRLFGDIDPDKVFIMGYSHGGYGAYAIGPKMPDRFAAIHASAAAATDGETTAKTLLSTPFTALVGEHDTMYGRYERNLKFRKEVEALRGDRTDIYPVKVTISYGKGHSDLSDGDKIADMYPFVRNPVPREVDWLMTDDVIHDFFWLHVANPAKQGEISGSCVSNTFALTANENVADLTILMDSRLVDFTRPVSIEVNGTTIKRHFTPSLKTLCETLARRGDPAYAFSAMARLKQNAKSKQLTLE